MLIKLIRRDFSYTWREFAGLTLAFILTAIFGIAAAAADNSFYNESLFAGISILAIIGVSIATVIISIACQFRLFQRNIYTNEGYLTMSLPVNPYQLILSKLIVGTFWIVFVIIAITAISTVSAQILLDIFYKDTPYEFSLWTGWRNLDRMYHITENWSPSIGLSAIIWLVSIPCGILHLDLSCAIAHLPQFRRFRIIVGILAFFGISIATSYITRALRMLLDIFVDIDANVYISSYDMIYNPPVGMLNTALLCTIFLQLIVGAVLYLATVYMVTKRLELE